ncbi:DUF6077 domain-containing protein [Planctomycetota bacterium]
MHTPDPRRPPGSSEERGHVSAEPLSLIADSFIVFFALWTAYCNVLVLTGQSFDVLVTWLPIPSAIALAVLWLLVRARFRAVPDPPVPERSHAHSHPPLGSRNAKAIGVAALCVVILHVTGSYATFWLLAVVLLSYVVATEPRPTGSGGAAQPTTSRRACYGFALLAVVAVIATLISHRPDSDDDFYLNVVVTALDFPHEGLLSHDGMHGIPGVPLLSPTYRIGSFELLTALLAHMTGISHFTIYYLVLPALFAFLVVLAHALVLRRLLPGGQVVALLFVLVVLVTWGDSHLSVGNLALVRLYQGKAVLASVVVPLVFHYALRYSAHPCGLNLLLLAGVQITGLGCSSTGMVVVPVCAALVLLAAWRPSRDGTLALVFGALSFLYPVIVAMVMLLQVRSEGGVAVAQQVVATKEVLSLVLGTGGRAYLALFALLAAPVVVSAPFSRSFLARFVLLAVVFVMSPWSPGLVASAVSDALSWRCVWVIPFALLLGVMAAGIQNLVRRWVSEQGGLLAVAGLILAFAVFSPSWTISPANRTSLGFPRPKVFNGFSTAETVVRVTPPRGSVLACRVVANALPMFRNHPYPVAVGFDYLSLILSRSLDEAEVSARRRMFAFVSGVDVSFEALQFTLAQVSERSIDCVVFPAQHPLAHFFVRELGQRGYESHGNRNFEVWLLARSSGRRPPPGE